MYLHLLGLATLIFYLLKRRRAKQSVEPAHNQVLDVSDYNITVINDEYQCEEYFAQQVQMSHRCIGLDCEWISSNRKQPDSNNGTVQHSLVALLQIAFPNKDCSLVRLCNVGKITPSLAELLQDRR